MSFAIPASSIPPICTARGHVTAISNCMVNNINCFMSCLPKDPKGDPSMDIFTIPVDAADCGEFEEGLCAVTDCFACKICSGPINDLFRCIILNSPTLANYEDLRAMVDVCPLSCDLNNYLLDPTGNSTRYLN
jgi:hypothetical protein